MFDGQGQGGRNQCSMPCRIWISSGLRIASLLPGDKRGALQTLRGAATFADSRAAPDRINSAAPSARGECGRGLGSFVVSRAELTTAYRRDRRLGVVRGGTIGILKRTLEDCRVTRLPFRLQASHEGDGWVALAE